ncbi:hypothetical protein IQ07DRAFT_631439 [Pyrenochaeta sp. DS3sAY3a]|nr:hypothetical protein IQ07DRAFT_631439 [Pyrenochaeta sp. DS3sAY3a]
MHILGLANGSKGGNSEILLKAALLSAKQSDPSITTSWIHVPSVSYPPNPKPLASAPDISGGTIASNNLAHDIGSLSLNGHTARPTRDDRAKVFNAILDADALIFSTAVYSHQPAGALKALLDTLLGPYTDPALITRIQAAQRNGEKSKYAAMSFDPRILKPRVAGFLATGGSSTPDQFTMVLPTLHLFAYSLHVKIVDQVVFMGYANPGAVLSARGDEVVQRAKLLGGRVASQIGRPFDDAEYLGPEPEGACPHCHLCKMELFGGAENAIGCVVCGNTGRLRVEGGGKVVTVWDEDSEFCCVTMKGKMKHVDDIFKKGSAEWKGLDGDAGFRKRLEEWRGVDAGEVRFEKGLL